MDEEKIKIKMDDGVARFFTFAQLRTGLTPAKDYLE